MMYLRTVCVTSVLAHCTVIHSNHQLAYNTVWERIITGLAYIQFLDACICIYDMFVCEMFLKIVISIYVCVYVVIKFLINKLINK